MSPTDPITTEPEAVVLPPKMPEAWLDQLRQEAKKGYLITLVTSLLGSSVIAAVITGFVSLRIESYKKQAALELEAYKKPMAIEIEEAKTKLKNHNDELAAKKVVLDGVKANFLRFALNLDDYMLALEAAAKTPEVGSLVAFRDQRLDEVVKQMGVITTTAPKEDEFTEIDNKIDEVLQTTGLVLNNGSSPQTYPHLRDQYERIIKPKINDVEKLLNEKAKTLVL